MSALIRKPGPEPKVDLPLVRLSFWPECHHEVPVGALTEPCERVAVALRLDFTDSTQGAPYPVCARHISKRRGEMVSLLAIVRARP